MPARRPIWHCFQDVAIKETDLLANDVRGGLNIPLFFGPAGTFVGIIIGVSGFSDNVSGLLTGSQDTAGLNGLRWYKFGYGSEPSRLLFTVVATLNCKSASRKMEVGMNDYFDFLRRELMPTLATSMSSSPMQLKAVLDRFADKFLATTTPKPPRNLNENLVLQQRMLEAVSGMNMTKTANRLPWP